MPIPTKMKRIEIHSFSIVHSSASEKYFIDLSSLIITRTEIAKIKQ